MIEIITVSLFVIICLMAMFRSSWALALLVVLFPIKQALQASSGFFLANYALPNYIAAIVTMVSVLREVSKQQTPMLGYFSGSLLCTVVIFTWSAVSLMWTPSFASGSDFITTNIPYFLLFILLAPLLMRGMAEYRDFVVVLLWISSLVAILILINPVFTSESGRIGVQLAQGVRTNPLAIGELGGLLVLTAALFRSDPMPKLLVVIRVVGFISGTLLALQSGSRGQILFAVTLAVIFFPVASKVRNIRSFIGSVIGIATIGAVVGFLGLYLLEGYALRRWDADSLDDGIGVRLANLVDLFVSWLSNPSAWLIGLGFNAFTSLGSAQASLGYTHNLPIDILTELGIPIFWVFLVFNLNIIQSSRWLFAHFREDSEYRPVVATAIALVVYQFLLINKQGMLWGSPTYFMWCLLIIRTRHFEATSRSD